MEKMTTTTQLLVMNPWTSYNSSDSANKNILAKEQKTRIMKELYKIADKELRENETARRECLAHLREWIRQNPDIENCIMDDNFLLSFLRVKKFSIPMAQQTLLKYLNFRKKFNHIMCDLDYTDPKINELIDSGYIFVSPFRDSYGRRVIIYDTSRFDLQKFNGNDLSRAHIITYETLISDEDNQILGVNHVGDIGGVGPGYLTLFSITEFGYLIKWGEQSFPLRHKEINLINVPTAVKYIYDFAVSLMSQKLKDRLVVHASRDRLHEKVDKRCLPLEFGGEMPAKEMIEMWKEELAAKRKRLMSLDAMNLLSDRGIIRRKKPSVQDDEGSLPGSFRKLELD
ncbi:cellular retinaldehyde binding protein isoform X2 [Leptinotarsa decemlineata]|uniref:cellular retinaldehyde binding protein isoform X2 n=1 Tax=Leptinotarsa decemlineata TaxID=7539 RepID=UPI003D3061CE